MKYNHETEILLCIIRGDNMSDVTDVDSGKLLALARRHKLSYPLFVLAQKNEHLLSQNDFKTLEEQVRKGALKSLNQLNELKKVVCSFHANKIRFACIKGPQLARVLYGRDASKESVDLDILLGDPVRLDDVHSLMRSFGYVRTNLDRYPAGIRRKVFLIAKREVFFYHPELKCTFDLHIRPGSNTYLTERRFGVFLENWLAMDLDGTSVNVPDDETYFVFLCYHGALHRFSRLAWLMDIRTFLVKKNASLDYFKIFRLARQCQIERTVELTFGLLKTYFDDDFYTVNRSVRMDYLISVCVNASCSNTNNSISKRLQKFCFMMVLLKGTKPKIDWIYGMFMRQLAHRIAIK